MPGKERHADLRPLGRAPGQCDERVGLALPAADTWRRARLRRQPNGNVLVLLALVAERVERGKHDVELGIAQRIQERCTTMIACGTARPRAHCLDAHGCRAILQ